MTNPTEGAMPPLPELPDNEVIPYSAIRYVDGYAKSFVHEYAISYAKAYAAPLLARVAELQAERDAANKLLKTALQPLELYNAYGWSDRAGVRASIKKHLAALAAKEQQP